MGSKVPAVLNNSQLIQPLISRETISRLRTVISNDASASGPEMSPLKPRAPGLFWCRLSVPTGIPLALADLLTIGARDLPAAIASGWITGTIDHRSIVNKPISVLNLPDHG